ncbi:NAD(+) synthase [Asticcacaulis endophyticus]|uniref:Glutamine-dependent NAD(+) synthetase n=1 Tax=Asticcacaulis endophyticus TaxID=1395890 RepID=A0A918PSB8_9CAUL|nr:NAD(+) synthase [Asticcacaulis endophyticus]GGZ21209.1 NAD(+) synthase [Asticcacaulis endophyticus]
MPKFDTSSSHGFVRIACVTPKVHLANPPANLAEHVQLATRADEAGADLLVFPELSLTGYSLDDLFLQESLLDSAKQALVDLITASRELRPVLIVGVPLRVNGAVYNCASVIQNGRALGIVPKTYLPNYREYYEKRWFASGRDLPAQGCPIRLNDQGCWVDNDMTFGALGFEDFTFAIEICEDLWAPHTPSTELALNGANIIINLSASPVVVGKSRARKALCAATSERLMCAYAYSAAGPGESTTDLAWDGQSLIYELGQLVSEGERFRSDTMTLADVDVERIALDRLRNGTFNDARHIFMKDQESFPIGFDYHPHDLTEFHRHVPRFPYVPADKHRLDEDCYEAFNIQVHGLMQRLEATGTKHVVIGISGGLDSTHALIVACKAFDRLGLPRENIHGYTMPGFGTTLGSKTDALKLMKALGISGEVLDIRPAAKRMLMDIGHPYGEGKPVYDINFENVQAGLRTDFLFRLAGEKKGFVVGTGDLSELALGWSTYGVGDHMSHYNVNCGAPKTLIQHLIRWAATKEFDARTGRILKSVLEREISPELVPVGADGALQKTEDKVGPYELQDFTLYYITRFGLKPSKVAYLAYQAWKDKDAGEWPQDYPDHKKRSYTLAEIKKWMEVFLWRFFTTSQFKRSAVPNGPKLISGGALSPRGDWRAPSDATAKIWLDELRANVPDQL